MTEQPELDKILIELNIMKRRINMKKISDNQYKELIDFRNKLRALEEGGVDNWEGYDDSLESYYEDKEKEEALLNLSSDIIQVVSDSIVAQTGEGPSIIYGPDINPETVADMIKEYLEEE